MSRLRLPAALLAAALCAAAPPALAWDTLAVLCADYSGPGRLTAVARGPAWPAAPDVATLGTDPIGRWHGGRLYAVNRAGGDNVQVLDPQDGWRTARQFSVGAGRNPQDIAFAPDGTAYVSCYDQAVLLRVDVEAGAVLEAVSTAPFADADGLPETGWMAAVGWRLYVTAQRLDRDNWYLPSGPGLLLVYDMLARQWVDADPAQPGTQGVTLLGSNPSGQPEVAPGGDRLRLGCVGRYLDADGGVEEVDLQALASAGFLVTEAALGGDLLDFTVAGGCRAFAIVSDAAFHTSVKAWSPCDGAVGPTLVAADDYVHADLAWDGGAWLYVADRTLGRAGLRVFAVATGLEQTTAAIATGLAPAWIAVPRDPAATGVPAAGPVPPLALAPPAPNPANPGAVIRLRGRPGAVVPLRVTDLRGRLVREAAVPLDAAGDGVFRFDGRDGRGRPVASGRYVVAAGRGEQTARAALTIAR